MQEKLSIWIPTKNRPFFLLRLLEYYKNTSFKGYLLIGDSSNGKFLEINKQSVKKYNKYLNINYCEFPNMSVGIVSSKLVPQIETEFSTILSDDDILITTSIEPCLRYLIDHKDVSCVNGKSFFFGIDSDYNACGQISFISNYSLAENLGSNAKDRLSYIFSNMKNINMSIHRTSNQKVIFEKVKKLSELHSMYNFEELIGCALISIRGKVVQLPYLFLLRQVHSKQTYRSIDFFDWFTDKDWHNAFNILQDTVINELGKVDQTDQQTAKDVFKNIFWPYYANLLTQSWKTYSHPNNHHNIKNINLQNNKYYFNKKNTLTKMLKNILGVKTIVNKIRNQMRIISFQERKPYLNDFLKPSNTYHNDFMPIYNVITNNTLYMTDKNFQENK